MFLSLCALRCCKRHITFPRQSGKENFFKKDFSFSCPLPKWGSLSYAAIYESVLCAYSSTTVHLKSANAEVLGLSQGAQALQYMSSPLQFSWQLLYLNIMRCVLLMLRHLLWQQRCANDMNNMLFSIFISSVFDTSHLCYFCWISEHCRVQRWFSFLTPNRGPTPLDPAEDFPYYRQRHMIVHCQALEFCS